VTELTIRYRHSVRNRIEDAIIALDAVIHDEPEWITATFRVSDVRTVCKHLFILGKDAELLQPASAREVMSSMISEIHSLYSRSANAAAR
jgi:predicted DNA-binding transcriptional regulator YafY